MAGTTDSHKDCGVTELPPTTERKLVVNVLCVPLLAALTDRVDADILSLKLPVEL
jgi:hypothetical protein